MIHGHENHELPSASKLASPKLVEEVNVEDHVQLRRNHVAPEGVCAMERDGGNGKVKKPSH